MQHMTLKNSIVKKVTDPTAWISNTVYREKLVEAYVCASILAKQSIKALKPQSTPFLQSMSYCLGWTMLKYFPVSVCTMGFTNIELRESSLFWTTMHNPISYYCSLCMPFRVSLGSEEYQHRQHEALEGFGVVNKAHDILVLGSGDSFEGVEEAHDINLMLQFHEVNLKLNHKKFQFRVNQVTWMGNLFRSISLASPHIQIGSRSLMTWSHYKM